jgi:hypothetical protein
MTEEPLVGGHGISAYAESQSHRVGLSSLLVLHYHFNPVLLSEKFDFDICLIFHFNIHTQTMRPLQVPLDVSPQISRLSMLNKIVLIEKGIK